MWHTFLIFNSLTMFTMQIYGKGPVAVMPDDAAGRETHPLFFHASVDGHPSFFRMPILSLLQWAFLAS
ncbi:hypothetical protein DXA15_25170 [Parabacteroides sp. AM58-2XD]|nr:hypothetical protein DXA15_25170 [Parabacteroides sp. AM58-2XD]